MKMKAKIIVINWAASLLLLSVDTESTPLGVIAILFSYFAASSLLLIFAHRCGWLKELDLTSYD